MLNSTSILSFVAATTVHALMLFTIRVDHHATLAPLNGADTAMELTLVEPAEEDPVAIESSPPAPPETPPPEPVLEPPPEPQQIAPPTPVVDPPPVARQRPIPQPRNLPAPRRAAQTAQRGDGARTMLTAPARYRSNPKPVYPGEARRLGQEGTVYLRVEVSANGRVTDVRITRGSGFPLLDQAALQAVRRWTFDPARALALPVASTPEVPVRFHLQ